MDVKTRALPLLAMADHISRASAFRYGALVGLRLPQSVTVTDAFDIKHDAGGMDVEFLQKKLALLQTVVPAAGLVGLYCCDPNREVPRRFACQLAESGVLEPLIYMVPCAEGRYECFSVDSGAPVPYSLVPGESEVTAVATVQNHANYSLKDSGGKLETATSMGPSFRQLEEHVRALLRPGNLGALVEKHLVHLAQLVQNFKGPAAPENHEALAAHLSLLASQIATVKCANAQLAIQTTAMDKRGYRQALEPRRNRGGAPSTGL
ncbi:hypothetical protein METBIDRAFT_183841 [Metschnikowia bicuspidata var. bicuspidata NRRL YB-4993]|uniref:Rpn11/EIF3F C-terminal domain-containing protein n=1 Tax=Metschnikowia bicuspidata var. bicuspidata NRRL YB-4993 TaxID=869754 RepID=A0A1A0HC09_9ASCO|nr:hypothetical protein METBIDRAFT_183841 [Metschnikowia bicuspidata var. bicuspidata NRRL YB-4993]OBA21412.1 hypothetical protein METBIDRAFT_183841 [Metschnikowia bicuspidata var. bicuspidata NRRL YB-4993]